LIHPDSAPTVVDGTLSSIHLVLCAKRRLLIWGKLYDSLKLGTWRLAYNLIVTLTCLGLEKVTVEAAVEVDQCINGSH